MAERFVDRPGAGPKISEVPDLGGKVKKNFGDAPVIPLLLIFIGGYLAWFGVHYWRDQVTVWPTDPVKDVLQGRGMPVPVRAPDAGADIPASDTAPTTPPSADGNAIAQDALKYVGTKYVWGGSDPARGWDCSGMVNWVLCHDMGLDIPHFKGGTFGPNSGHGPVVSDYIAWSGVTPVGSTGTVQAGDLLAWGPDQHIGIAVSNTDFVSAQNPRVGTIKAPIVGFSVSFPIVLRLNASSIGPADAKGQYSHDQLMGLWTLAGGDPAQADQAAAIAQAESSGNADATSSNPDGGQNVGLWQLDTKGKGAGFSEKQLKDPLTNARVAIQGSSNGIDWSAWQTFVTGAFVKFLAGSGTGSTQAAGTGTAGGRG